MRGGKDFYEKSYHLKKIYTVMKHIFCSKKKKHVN